MKAAKCYNRKKTGWVRLIFISAVWVVLNHAIIATGGERTPLHPGYPEKFDRVGTIDAVAGDSIVINDSTYQLLSGTTFHTEYGDVGIESFKVGYEVGFLKEGKYSISSLWLISEIQEKEKAMTDREYRQIQEENKSNIKLQGGVWTN